MHFIQKIQLPTPVAAAMVTDNDITSYSGRDNDKGCYDGSKQKVAKLERLNVRLCGNSVVLEANPVSFL